MWAGGRKAHVKPHQLLVELEKFACHAVVSQRVCVSGKGHLYFVDGKAKVIITNDKSPLNNPYSLSTGLSRLGARLESYHKLQPKSKTIL